MKNINEISKKVLGSYISKAGEDLLHNKNKESRARGDAEFYSSGGYKHGSNPELAFQARKDADTYSNRAERRAKGLAMAGKKITNESTLEEYVNNVVKRILEDLQTPRGGKVVKEDIFDSPSSAAASRANIKKATKVLGASSPHTKALTRLHSAIKKSPYYYGTSDDELARRWRIEGDKEYPNVVPDPKPTLTPMTGKGFDGYDAMFGRGDKKVKLGVIKRAAAAIQKRTKGK